MATSETGEQQGTSSSSSSARNFERANRALSQLDLVRENLTQVELSRALIFLLGWPEARREEVLAAARDNNFGLRQFEIPKEVIRAAREDTLGPVPEPSGASASGEPIFQDAPRDPFISTAYYVSLTSAADSIANLASSRGMLLGQVRRRSPQICKKCLQPRKGHICQPLSTLRPASAQHHLLPNRLLPPVDAQCISTIPSSEPKDDLQHKPVMQPAMQYEGPWRESIRVVEPPAGCSAGMHPAFPHFTSNSDSEPIVGGDIDRVSPSPRDETVVNTKRPRLG